MTDRWNYHDPGIWAEGCCSYDFEIDRIADGRGCGDAAPRQAPTDGILISCRLSLFTSNNKP